MRERIAALEDELNERESTLMEAQITKMTVETDNRALQQALADARRQKAQLEAALMSEPTHWSAPPSEGGLSEDPCTGDYSDEEEDGEDDASGSDRAGAAPSRAGGAAGPRPSGLRPRGAGADGEVALAVEAELAAQAALAAGVGVNEQDEGQQQQQQQQQQQREKGKPGLAEDAPEQG
ncbi:hypothetical protein MNEG_10788 [Monoraphidium neglectum]|uniref:Uncharacterized protein n=1 Tax=Monoraphidium neglectum TaxID=145388 RepID=A0A0D2JBU7_9CHLO|nr:hypothetical protein MNEG_10788 [Monoraphidium neglectum]KIY97172.1 hypothetical protein MNEG_10788 [Monoraphidium neglectum]|eukprot:XP_013896192.1 hypothetical protein MNEG_10788 [Monoraphidium neglectum]